MIKPVFSIRDRKAQSFWHPRLDDNEAAARRWFAMLVNNPDPNNVVGYAPSDFELYQIGDFELDTGDFSAIEPKQFICSGDQLVGD